MREAGAQLQVVVDLPVEDDAERSIRVQHGLAAAGEVDDAQTGEPERQAPGRITVFAAIVGSAVDEMVRHPPREVLRHRRGRSEVVGSRDPAHAP
jgi:hypothetical protein